MHMVRGCHLRKFHDLQYLKKVKERLEAKIQGIGLILLEDERLKKLKESQGVHEQQLVLFVSKLPWREVGTPP